MANEKLEVTTENLLEELTPEELEPRLEMQVLVDPLATIVTGCNNVNCRDGGNCEIQEN